MADSSLYEAVAGDIEEPEPPSEVDELIPRGHTTTEVAQATGKAPGTVRKWRAKGRIPKAEDRRAAQDVWHQNHPFDLDAAVGRRLGQLRRRGGHVVISAMVRCSKDHNERDIEGYVTPPGFRQILNPIHGAGTDEQWADAERRLILYVTAKYFTENHVGCHITRLLGVQQVTVGPRQGESSVDPGWESRM